MKDLSPIYNHLYENGYGVSNRFRLVKDLISKYAVKDIIDLGCGHGEYSVELTKMGYNVVGIDIIKPELTKCINYIQTKEYKYPKTETIMCVDVLEHIPTEEVPEILKAMKQSCSITVMTIAHTPAYNKGPNGELLHLTVKPLNWWLDEMENIGMSILEKHAYNNSGTSLVVAKCNN